MFCVLNDITIIECFCVPQGKPGKRIILHDGESDETDQDPDDGEQATLSNDTFCDQSDLKTDEGDIDEEAPADVRVSGVKDIVSSTSFAQPGGMIIKTEIDTDNDDELVSAWGDTFLPEGWKIELSSDSQSQDIQGGSLNGDSDEHKESYARDRLQSQDPQTSNQRYNCPVCPSTFAHRRSLNYHLKRHGGEKAYVCMVCSRRFVNKPSLVGHMRKHTGEKPFQCSICKKDFRHKTSLTYHMTSAHKSEHANDSDDGKKKPYDCETCGEKFPTRSTLRRHQSSHTGDQTYVCRICDKKFAHKNLYASHFRLHADAKPYKCTQCDAAYTSEGGLKYHMASFHTTDKPFRCISCGKSFKLARLLKMHQKNFRNGECLKPFRYGDDPGSVPSKHDETESEVCTQGVDGSTVQDETTKVTQGIDSSFQNKTYKCTQCDAAYKSEGGLKYHLASFHTTEKPFLCASCGRSFKLAHLLKMHQKNFPNGECIKPFRCAENFDNVKDPGNVPSQSEAHNLHDKGPDDPNLPHKPYKCTKCDATYKSEGGLKYHLASFHTTEKPFQCTQCGKLFKVMILLKMHQLSHSDDHRYKCEICDAHFTSKPGLKYHMKSRHLPGPPPQPLLCSVCGDQFSSKQSLRQHTKALHRWFECRLCDRKFVSKGGQDYHMRWHRGEKPFTCPVCSTSFRSMTGLKRHSVTHDDKTPYACPSCEKRCKTKEALFYHSLTHSDKRPYVCSQCGDGFKLNALLQIHVRIKHTGEKPYQCKVCNAKFAAASYRRKHMSVHSTIKPFLCSICGAAFKRREHLVKHSKIHNKPPGSTTTKKCRKKKAVSNEKEDKKLDTSGEQLQADCD